jgi:hypothetical protein
MSMSHKNLLILLVAFLLPVVAQLYSLGLGFDVLLYEPFDFAYMLLVGMVLLIANITQSVSVNWFQASSVAFIAWVFWFGVTFLTVGQIHIYMGGQL